jgi:hypothetical protein
MHVFSETVEKGQLYHSVKTKKHLKTIDINGCQASHYLLSEVNNIGLSIERLAWHNTNPTAAPKYRFSSKNN